MKEDINKLIEINLPIIAKEGHLFISEFFLLDKSLFNCKKFANELINRNLGTLTNERFDISEHGLDIVENGGWFIYFNKQIELKKIEAQRQERKDKSEELDLRKKTWDFKFRLVPYIFSLLALLVSILSYFKPEKKQLDLQLMQKEIQSLKSKMKRIDSLTQLDIHQKKRNE